ncbi:MAG: cyclic nucleotide-binding domain-containing protein [Rubrivivax sp.]|nr:cyclic nucleotide-binding domain-containing protein [Rubrivivax sp.]
MRAAEAAVAVAVAVAVATVVVAATAGKEAALAEAELAPLVERLLAAQSGLFAGIEPAALAALLRRSAHRLHLAAGEDLVTEGDAADAIYFIESGRFEVRKRSEGGSGDDVDHRIGEMDSGSVVGEVALLDRGTRSTTVRALADASVLVLQLGDPARAAAAALDPALQMQLNLAGEMARKMRHVTSGTVRHLEASLLEARTRVEMGRFMSRVLIGTCLYMFAMVLMQPLRALVPDSTVFSVLVLLGFAFGLWLNIRTSMFPPGAYGFTLEGWRPALREAVLFSLPILAAIVGLKWLLLHASPAFEGRQLFDLYRPAALGAGGTLAVAAAYALFVPVQEMVARSGIQSSLAMYLRGRHRVPMSIFMSTLLFSSTHLHTGVVFALAVFPMGLFWGWLYSRHPTLVGVVCSHLLIGLFAVFVVSFPYF